MPYAFIPEKATDAIHDLSGVTVKVLVALATFMPGRGQEGCFPSLMAIGERAGIKREKTVTAAIKKLVAAGVVTCERRRRQTSLFKWACLEQAESAGTRILDTAVSDPSKPLEQAVSAPLNPVLEPALSAQVYPALSAPLRYPMKEPSIYTQNADKPPSSFCSETASQETNSQGEKQPIPSPQGNQNPSPTPSRPKVTWDGTRIIVPDVFLESWAESYPHVDLRLAINQASAWCLSNPSKRPKKNFARFLNLWLGRVRPGDQSYIDLEEQAEDDADLIRQAKEAFPDPDERAAFFWARKEKGLRVPSGVDCRPMPAEKEMAI